MRFADADRGWLGVEDGILGSIDGGTTWARQLASERVTSIWSVDTTHAWALAADDTVYRTQDGAHWSALPATTPPITDIDFVSPLVGWAIGVVPLTPPIGRPVQRSGTLLATTDGGAVWRPITQTGLWSVCFTSERDGLGANGKQILRTRDAGRTWSKIADLTITDDGPWYPSLFCADANSARVQVTEPYAALSHVPYLIFSTVDGGANWTLDFREGYTLGSTTPQGLPGLGSYPSTIGTLANAHTWFITCSPPTDTQAFLVLDPAGHRLAERSVPFVACARGASFVDDEHGWAIATSYLLSGTDLRSTGIVVRTTDAARSWALIYPR